MRVKGLFMIAAAITVSVGGTAILSQAMADRYEKPVTKIVSSDAARSSTDSAVESKDADEIDSADKSPTDSDVEIKNADETDLADETKKDEGTGKIKTNKNKSEPDAYMYYPIWKEYEDGFSVEKTKADMSFETAVACAMKWAEKIFYIGEIKEVTNVDLCETEVMNELKEGEGEREEGYYRAYSGIITYKKGPAVYFEVDSINGLVYKLEKIVNQKDKAYDNPVLTEKIASKIRKEKKTYKKIAVDLLKETFGGGIECNDVLLGSLSFEKGKYKCQRIVADVLCQEKDGTMYEVLIDSHSEHEVIGLSTRWTDDYIHLENEIAAYANSH